MITEKLLRNLISIAEESTQKQYEDIDECKKWGSRDAAASIARNLRHDLRTIREARRTLLKIDASLGLLKTLNSIFIYCTFEHITDWRQFRSTIGEMAGQAIAKVETK